MGPGFTPEFRREVLWAFGEGSAAADSSGAAEATAPDVLQSVMVTREDAVAAIRPVLALPAASVAAVAVACRLPAVWFRGMTRITFTTCTQMIHGQPKAQEECNQRGGHTD
jgi:hypothetical protein